MDQNYIIALDQGTTSSRAVLFDLNAKILAIEQKEFTQFYPKPGWVEHDPEEVWQTQYKVLLDLIKNNNVDPKQVICLGITNQRETTVIWDRKTGKPLYNAIVWQDKRTAEFCESLKEEGLENYISSTTGLVIDSYFSATKLHWILNNVGGLKEKALQNEICFGTIDSWLIWKLTNHKKFVTDISNASRTMLFNINDLAWDKKLIDRFGASEDMLPEVLGNTDDFGSWNYQGVEIPITGAAGDQHAALFGQACFNKGMVKNTYGTGCFMLMNIGDSFKPSEYGLVNTIGYKVGNKITYALEGSIFIAGAAIQWLRDGLKMLKNASDTEEMAVRVKDSNEVVFVPALSGLGAPYWDMYARGAIFGLTRDTTAEHIAKAALDSIAFQTRDILDAMQNDSGIELKALKVDGGAVSNDYLMQFQADILGVEVNRPVITESTALGAAYMAGLKMDLWDMDKISEHQKIDKTFHPRIESKIKDELYQNWQKAVKRTMNWVDKKGD